MVSGISTRLSAPVYAMTQIPSSYSSYSKSPSCPREIAVCPSKYGIFKSSTPGSPSSANWLVNMFLSPLVELSFHLEYINIARPLTRTMTNTDTPATSPTIHV